jgi:OOP family OmpA-OmpF porin
MRERRAFMSTWIKLGVAAALVAALAVWSIHGPGLAGGSAARAEEKLQVRADERLRGVRADWARVEMRGQRAVLTGVAPTEEELLIARGALRTAVWNGGWLLGGVSKIDSSRTQVWAQRQGPYAWRADLDLNRLRLSGAAPESGLARELESFAGALFPSRRVVNDLSVDPVPPGEGWAEAARAALAVLSHLEVGSAALSDFELTVAGEAATAADANAARQSLERLTGVVSATSRAEIRAPRTPVAPLTVQPPADRAAVEPARIAIQPTPAAPPPAVPDPEAEPEADQAREAEARAACQTRLDAALDESAIHFDVDSAALAPESLPRLDALAAIAAACPRFALRVEGHTDDTGVETANATLSERRARVVVDRLAERGVDLERLSAVGLGASRPAAENATAEGRRANRRIEIIVEP